MFKKNIEVKINDNLSPLIYINLNLNNKRIAFIQCVLENENTLLIGDIIHIYKKYHNKGYGTKMMEKLLEYTKENNIKTIYGNLSLNDIDHKDRLLHFYKKFGFDVEIYDEVEENYFGRIEKILK